MADSAENIVEITRTDGSVKCAYQLDIPQLTVPLVTEQVPLGKTVADIIESLVDRYPLAIKTNGRTALGQLQQWMSERSFTPHRGQSLKHADEIHPLHGRISDAPYYAALVRRPADPPEYDCLRAIVLCLTLTDTPPRGGRTIASGLAILLRNSERIQFPDEVRRIDESLRAGDYSAEDIVTDLHVISGHSKPHLSAAVQCCFTPSIRETSPPEADDKSATPPGYPPHCPVISITSPKILDDYEISDDEPLDDQVLVAEWQAPNLIASASFDLEDDDVDEEVICVDEQLTPAVAEFFFAERTRHHLQGVLLADTERTLSRSDSATLWSVIHQAMESASMNPSHVNALGCDMVIALMLTTGRSRKSCAAALLNFLGIQEDENDDFVLQSNHFVGSLPIEYPGLGKAPEKWFHPVSDRLRLQLPADLVFALTQLQILSSDRAHGWALRLTEAELTARLRGYKSTVPMLTENRLTNCLPIAVYMQTGHMREAQLISGDDAFRSSASLHYPYYESQRLQVVYNQALESIGIRAPEQSGKFRISYIGARRGAMKQEKIRAAVTSLTERTAQAVDQGKTLPGLVEAHNRLAAYTCIVFGFATANRFTESVGNVTRADIISCSPVGYSDTPDVAFIGLVHDKGKAAAIDQRVCALPTLVGNQINTLLKRSIRLRASLKRVLGNQWADVIAALDAACDGTGPLWFRIDSTHQDICPLNRGVLKELWPEWVPPIEWSRHLFASTLYRYGMAGGDIAQHMGHRIDSPTFSATDPDCPIDFGLRCAPAIAAYLEALGFEQIGEIKRRNTPLPMPRLRSPSAILSAAAADLDLVSKLNDEERLISADAEEIEEAGRRVDVFLSEQQPHPIYVVDPCKIDAWLSKPESTANASRRLQAAMRSALASRLATLGDSAIDKKVPAIPQLRHRQWEPASIRSAHFEALRWARRAHDRACDGLAERKQQTETREIVFGVILLACWGVAITRQHLTHLLSPATTLHAAPELGGHAAAALQIAQEDSRYTQTQIIPQAAVALLARMKILVDTSESPQCIEDAWQDFATLLPELAIRRGSKSLDLVLNVIALARQVTTGGDRAAWERGALRAVGPVPERFFAALQNTVTKQEEPSSVVRPVEDPERPLRTDTNTSHRLFKRMRSALHKVRTHPSSGHYREILADRVHETIRTLPPTSVTGVMAALVDRRLTGQGLAWKSLYHYMTTLSPLALKIGSLDLNMFEDETLINEARPLILTYETSGKEREREQTGSVISALAWLIEGCAAVGVDIDLGEIVDGLNYSRPRKAGYWISSNEQDWVLNQLAAWTESAYTDTHQLGRAPGFAAAELGTRIQFSNALRQGEVSHLTVKDLRIDGQWIQTNIRPRASHRLKRVASKRPAQIPTSRDNAERISILRDRIQNRRLDTNGELLSTEFRMSRTSIAARNTATLREASARVIPEDYVRSHAGRHNFASAVGAALRGHALHGITLHLPHTAWLDIDWLSALPLRIRLMYFSRQLGHGHPNSTLEWYDHTIPLLTDSARHWRTLPARVDAALLGAPPAAYRKARYRFEAGACSDSPPWTKHVDVVTHPLSSSEAIALAPLPVRADANNDRFIETIGEIALRLRQGLDGPTLANEVGLAVDTTGALSSEIRRYASILDYRYVDVDKSPSATRAHSRRPRAGAAASVLRALDRSMGDSLDYLELLGWCERNISSEMEVEFGFSDNDRVIRQAFESRAPFIPSDHASGFSETQSIPKHGREWILLACYTASQIRVKERARLQENELDDERNASQSVRKD